MVILARHVRIRLCCVDSESDCSPCIVANDNNWLTKLINTNKRDLKFE